MIPKILEYEDKRVKITPQAFAIPEIKALIDKYDMDVEPYLTYIHAMTAPDSPYVNIPAEERNDAALYDIQATIGEFDYEDPLVDEAIERFRRFYTTPNTILAEQAGEEIYSLVKWLKTTPYGDEENVKTRIQLLKDLHKVSSEYVKVKHLADEEMHAAVKGDHELGGYFED